MPRRGFEPLPAYADEKPNNVLTVCIIIALPVLYYSVVIFEYIFFRYRNTVPEKRRTLIKSTRKRSFHNPNGHYCYITLQCSYALKGQCFHDCV
jgi:hypothetical protein